MDLGSIVVPVTLSKFGIQKFYVCMCEYDVGWVEEFVCAYWEVYIYIQEKMLILIFTEYRQHCLFRRFRKPFLLLYFYLCYLHFQVLLILNKYDRIW